MLNETSRTTPSRLVLVSASTPLPRRPKLSTRPDHGSTGSYDAWPALTAEAIFRVGRKAEALDRLRSVTLATREGALWPGALRCDKSLSGKKSFGLAGLL